MTGALPRRNTRFVRWLAALATGGALLATAPAAMAAQRYASARSMDTVGSCTVIAPCRIDHAVGAATAGDEVIVLPGTYAVGAPVVASVPVDVQGVIGQPRPRLVGSAGLAPGGEVIELGAGGTLRHLAVETNAAGTYAVELVGAVGSDLEARGRSGGGGVQLTSAGASAVLRDSVAIADGATAVQAKDAATAAKILNVTAIATGVGAAAIKGKQRLATTIVRNTLARGADQDIATIPGALVALDHSNFRPAVSSGYTESGPNGSAEPVFVDMAAGDVRPLAGSPTIDAGSADDPALGTHDAAGRARTIGSRPDVGAYEFDPDAPPATTPIPVLAPPAPPVLGSTVKVSPAAGTVWIRPPGSTRSVGLVAGASVPVNSIIDTRAGSIRLTSVRDAGGTAQTGTFSGGVFQVRQARVRNPLTDLVLAGGNFRACRAGASAVGGGVVQALRWPRYVRRLWARDHGGRFRTRGRYGHAVVRGTKWLTADRCDGTLFSVQRGAIDVKRNRGGRTVRLRAGGRLFLPARR